MKWKFYLVFIGFLFSFACKNATEDKSQSITNEIDDISAMDQSKEKPGVVEKNSNSDSDEALDSRFKQFLGRFAKAGLPYQIIPKPEPGGDKIPLNYQAQYLSRAEDLDFNELREMQPYATFWYVSNPISTDQYNAVIYARSEMGSTFYVLCTFNCKGKLISFIEFAMYQLIGAGPQAGQEFSMSGSIDKNYTIKLVSDQGLEFYQINSDGNISKK